MPLANIQVLTDKGREVLRSIYSCIRGGLLWKPPNRCAASNLQDLEIYLQGNAPRNIRADDKRQFRG
jgi:hypothetical protein